MMVEPLSGDPLELAEQVELGLLVRVAPLGVEEPPGEVIEQCRAAEVAGVHETQVDRFAEDALIPGD
jgi:hypothetical protein